MGIKRALDIVLSLILLVLLSPVFAIVALVIAHDSNGSIIFKQVRSGKSGRLFVIYKFRTMLI